MIIKNIVTSFFLVFIASHAQRRKIDPSEANNSIFLISERTDYSRKFALAPKRAGDTCIKMALCHKALGYFLKAHEFKTCVFPPKQISVKPFPMFICNGSIRHLAPPETASSSELRWV